MGMVCGMGMAASDEYKERLSVWVLGEIEKAGSVSRLASLLSSEADRYISGEQLRKWANKMFVKELDPVMLSILAAYRGESTDQVRTWLEGGQSLGQVNPVTRKQVETIDNPEHLIELQIWISERIRFLWRNQGTEPPKTKAEFYAWLTLNAALATDRSELPTDRIKAIALGGTPSAEELVRLSRCWDADASWLLALFEITKTRSESKPKKSRPTKTQLV